MKLSISFVLLFALLAIAAALPTGKMPRKMRLKSLRATHHETHHHGALNDDDDGRAIGWKGRDWVDKDPCKECFDDFWGGCKLEQTAIYSDDPRDDPHPACDKVGETHCCSSMTYRKGMDQLVCLSREEKCQVGDLSGAAQTKAHYSKVAATCDRDTEGTCAVLGCDGWRNSNCHKDTNKCICPAGACRMKITGHDDGYGCVDACGRGAGNACGDENGWLEAVENRRTNDYAAGWRGTVSWYDSERYFLPLRAAAEEEEARKKH